MKSQTGFGEETISLASGNTGVSGENGYQSLAKLSSQLKSQKKLAKSG